MNIRIKVLNEGLLKWMPDYATPGAAAVDVRAAMDRTLTLFPGETARIKLGFAMAVPEGFAAVLIPRSGLGNKGLVLGNIVGLIDPDYRGELEVVAWNRNDVEGELIAIDPWDRIAQMVVVPCERVVWEVVEDLGETARGAGGFGHTQRG